MALKHITKNHKTNKSRGLDIIVILLILIDLPFRLIKVQKKKSSALQNDQNTLCNIHESV